MRTRVIAIAMAMNDEGPGLRKTKRLDTKGYIRIQLQTCKRARRGFCSGVRQRHPTEGEQTGVFRPSECYRTESDTEVKPYRSLCRSNYGICTEFGCW